MTLLLLHDGDAADFAGAGEPGVVYMPDLAWRVEKLRLEEQNQQRFLKAMPRFLPYSECRKWVQAFSRWKTKDDWREWIAMGEKRNSYIPVRMSRRRWCDRTGKSPFWGFHFVVVQYFFFPSLLLLLCPLERAGRILWPSWSVDQLGSLSSGRSLQRRRYRVPLKRNVFLLCDSERYQPIQSCTEYNTNGSVGIIA
jgi:hypothetical protein